jgi:hypothetical protein
LSLLLVSELEVLLLRLEQLVEVIVVLLLCVFKLICQLLVLLFAFC